MTFFLNFTTRDLYNDNYNNDPSTNNVKTSISKFISHFCINYSYKNYLRKVI